MSLFILWDDIEIYRISASGDKGEGGKQQILQGPAAKRVKREAEVKKEEKQQSSNDLWSVLKLSQAPKNKGKPIKKCKLLLNYYNHVFSTDLPQKKMLKEIPCREDEDCPAYHWCSASRYNFIVQIIENQE